MVILRAVLNGPTGHVIDMSVDGGRVPPKSSQARALALEELRKVALTHGIDLRTLLLHGSRETSDTGTGTDGEIMKTPTGGAPAPGMHEADGT